MKLLLTLLIILACSGCVTLSGEAPNGIKFTRTAFGVNPQVGVLIVDSKPDNSFKMTIRALDSNSTDAVGVAVAAAIGAMKTAQ